MNARRSVLPGALWALGAGLLAFLALESAVARHVGPDLLLPAAAGVFLPGRLGRLAGCLVLAFALALTDRGRSIGRALDRLCRKGWARWAAAAVCTGLFFVWALRVTVLSYMTNDDPFFLQIIARIPQEGLNIADRTFSHPILCWMIGKLYGLWPDGYWYLGYHLAVLLVSVTVIGRCLLCRTCRRQWPVWAGLLLHGLLCAGIFLYCFAAISFTVTPAAAGSAAVALVLCRDENRTVPGRLASDLAAAVLLCLCILQREETGMALLCFWALASVYQLARLLLQREKISRAILFAAVSVATLLCVWNVNDVRLIKIDWDYRSAESVRSTVVDFLNDELTLDQYELLGIPRELAVLIHGWYFMDQRVNTSLFYNLINLYAAQQAAPPEQTAPDESPPPETADTAPPEQTAPDEAAEQMVPDEAVPDEAAAAAEQTVDEPAPEEAPADTAFSRAVDRASLLLTRLEEHVRGDRQMSWRSGCILALLLGCFAALLYFGRRYLPEAVCALCAVGGALLMLLYLVQKGRFLLRVFLVVALPATVMLALLALTPVRERADIPAARRRIAAGLGALCAAAAAVCCLGCLYATPHAAEAATRADLFGDQWAVEQYAREHPDSTIITSMYEDYFDPLHTPADYPANRVLWGACGDTAKPAEERLYADAFFRDDVLFMTDNMATTLYLLQYLSLDWGPVQASVQDRVGSDVYICRLERLAPAADYTGWVEQNDMRFYFQDGQALAGTQTIDGTEYTFAPAGAQSSLAVSATENALVYTTDAYSLIDPEAGTP